MPNIIWVVADHFRGHLTDVTFEALALGREMAAALDAKLVAILAGSGVKPLAAELGTADTVLAIDHPSLAEPEPTLSAEALAQVPAEPMPIAILMPLTNATLGAATLLAERKNLPVVNFCRDLCVRDGQVFATSVLYGGKIEAVVTPGAGPAIYGIWPGARQVHAGHSTRTVPVEDVAFTPPATPRPRLKHYIEPEAGDIDITRQDALVAVGRGIQSKDNLELAEELASALGGAVCGSRPVIDQGWLPLSRQVGKSGHTVKPKVYVAMGISGAPEHLDGMKDAEVIIAVNTDARAPISELLTTAWSPTRSTSHLPLRKLCAPGRRSMPDPALALYFGVPGWAFLWVLTTIAFALFGLRVGRYVRILRAARPEPRWDHWGQRIRLFVVYVLGQRRLFDEKAIGVAHAAIFWAFVVYAAGFFWSLIRGLVPVLPVPYADQAPVMGSLLTVFGALGLVALAVAAVRRYVFTPQALERTRDATVILILIATVLVTMLAGQWYARRNESAAQTLWWAHMITVLGFLAYLPYSKHMHLLASPIGVLFGALDHDAMPSASEGAANRNEFTWRQLLGGLTCAECGRCERSCPSDGDPKMLMHHLKELLREDDNGGLLGTRVLPAQVWNCCTCGSCMERCPVLNEHIPVIIEMRRRLLLDSGAGGGLQQAMANLTRYGNSFGVAPRARPKWTAALDFPVKDARRELVPYLWITGDYASLDPRTQPATLAFARLLRRAGVTFGILYDAEKNSGNDVRRVGEEGLFDLLREKNLKAIESAHFERIVTTDPHTAHALKHEYPFNRPVEVLHSSELMWQLLRAGRLPLYTVEDLRVTYHDPCYLGRYDRIFEEPRHVLDAIGATVVEMPRNRGNSACCGAGGGRIWMEDAAEAKERPAEGRVREAAELGVSTLVVACPKDLVMFQDALKTTGLESKLEVKELAELVNHATMPVPGRIAYAAAG